MNLEELQQELRRLRAPTGAPPSGALRLSSEEALARRDAGNPPDGSGRTLRLVLHVSDPPEPGALERKRLLFEPDYHRAPTWRRHGSMPVNVVPLRLSRDHPAHFGAWYEDPTVGALEAEWQATGAVCGISIPSDMRGFVFKTVLALRSAGAEVSVESVSGSVARWLRPADAERVRTALRSANKRSTEA
jgi:hypothetical protein